MNKWASLQAFCLVAEQGSFTRAAESMGVTAAMVSKYVAQLEDELGSRLLTRSTRSVRFTEQGERYYQSVKPLLDELLSADIEVARGSQEPRGELRLSAPVDLGERLLPEVISAYQSRYPDVTVTLDLTDRQVDLFTENYDLALRAGTVRQPDLVARKVSTLELVLAASKEYLRSSPPLRSPHDLLHHNCLVNPFVSDAMRWDFIVDGSPVTLKVSSRLQANSARLLAKAAIDGHGLVYVPKVLLSEMLEQGRLQECLQPYIVPSIDVFLVYPERQYLPAKVSSFMDCFVECAWLSSQGVSKQPGGVTT